MLFATSTTSSTMTTMMMMMMVVVVRLTVARALVTSRSGFPRTNSDNDRRCRSNNSSSSGRDQVNTELSVVRMSQANRVTRVSLAFESGCRERRVQGIDSSASRLLLMVD